MDAAEPLELLFGGYFGPDWRDRYETWERAVDVFAGENETHLGATIEACDALLSGSAGDDTEVERALDEAGSTYRAPSYGQSYHEWLEEVADRLGSHAA